MEGPLQSFLVAPILQDVVKKEQEKGNFTRYDILNVVFLLNYLPILRQKG